MTILSKEELVAAYQQRKERKLAEKVKAEAATKAKAMDSLGPATGHLAN